MKNILYTYINGNIDFEMFRLSQYFNSKTHYGT